MPSFRVRVPHVVFDFYEELARGVVENLPITPVTNAAEARILLWKARAVVQQGNVSRAVSLLEESLWNTHYGREECFSDPSKESVLLEAETLLYLMSPDYLCERLSRVKAGPLDDQAFRAIASDRLLTRLGRCMQHLGLRLNETAAFESWLPTSVRSDQLTRSETEARPHLVYHWARVAARLGYGNQAVSLIASALWKDYNRRPNYIPNDVVSEEVETLILIMGSRNLSPASAFQVSAQLAFALLHFDRFRSVVSSLEETTQRIAVYCRKRRSPEYRKEFLELSNLEGELRCMIVHLETAMGNFPSASKQVRLAISAASRGGHPRLVSGAYSAEALLLFCKHGPNKQVEDAFLRAEQHTAEAEAERVVLGIPLFFLGLYLAFLGRFDELRARLAETENDTTRCTVLHKALRKLLFSIAEIHDGDADIAVHLADEASRMLDDVRRRDYLPYAQMLKAWALYRASESGSDGQKYASAILCAQAAVRIAERHDLARLTLDAQLTEHSIQSFSGTQTLLPSKLGAALKAKHYGLGKAWVSMIRRTQLES